MDADELVARYLSDVSNESDPARRRASIAALFDDNVRYVDQDGPIDGREAFTQRIDELASMMGPNARFTLTRPVQAVDDAVLFLAARHSRHNRAAYRHRYCSGQR